MNVLDDEDDGKNRKKLSFFSRSSKNGKNLDRSPSNGRGKEEKAAPGKSKFREEPILNFFLRHFDLQLDYDMFSCENKNLVKSAQEVFSMELLSPLILVK